MADEYDAVKRSTASAAVSVVKFYRGARIFSGTSKATMAAVIALALFSPVAQTSAHSILLDGTSWMVTNANLCESIRSFPIIIFKSQSLIKYSDDMIASNNHQREIRFVFDDTDGFLCFSGVNCPVCDLTLNMRGLGTPGI